jgi:hypothetical protein
MVAIVSLIPPTKLTHPYQPKLTLLQLPQQYHPPNPIRPPPLSLQLYHPPMPPLPVPRLPRPRRPTNLHLRLRLQPSPLRLRRLLLRPFNRRRHNS